MAAMKKFFAECAEAGRCPVSPETWSYLDGLEDADPTLDWIGYTEHDVLDAEGRMIGYQDCITMESARRLVAEGLANDEIKFFLECFGGFAPA